MNLTEEPVLKVMRLHPEAISPIRRTQGAAGYDLHICNNYKIQPMGRSLLDTGLAFAIPKGYYGRIAARSGSAWIKGIIIGAGVIDSDYRGEVRILVFNLTSNDLFLKAGEAVAQIIIEQIITPPVTMVACLESTVRGQQGFGSTSSKPTQMGSPEWLNLMKVLVPQEKQEAQRTDRAVEDEQINEQPAIRYQWQRWLNEDHLITLQDEEWTNPFAEGGGEDDEYLSAESNFCDEQVAHINEGDYDMDYPIQKGKNL